MDYTIMVNGKPLREYIEDSEAQSVELELTEKEQEAADAATD